jgi:transcriptional regulator with XRE-family HTH domain
MPPKIAVTPQPQHMGRKIEKIRTLKGIKQEELAKQLGITQSALSKIERSEEVEEDKLQKIAEALEMTIDALKNFSEEAVVNYIQNNYDGSPGIVGPANTQTNNINPLEKYVEAVEDIKRLYQALLDEKESKIKMLEGLMKNKDA